MENIEEKTDIIYNSEEINQLYNKKMNCISTIKHTFTFKNPRNINNDNFQAIIAQSSNNKSTLILEPNPKYELSKGNGIFLIRKVPAGTKLNIEDMNEINKGTQKLGLSLNNIGFNYENNGLQSSSLNTHIKELSHDIIVITIKGAGIWRGKQMLMPKVRYIEVDKRLERRIYKRYVENDLKNLEKIWENYDNI